MHHAIPLMRPGVSVSFITNLVEGFGFRVSGLGLGFRVEGLGFRE